MKSRELNTAGVKTYGRKEAKLNSSDWPLLKRCVHVSENPVLEQLQQSVSNSFASPLAVDEGEPDLSKYDASNTQNEIVHLRKIVADYDRRMRTVTNEKLQLMGLLKHEKECNQKLVTAHKKAIEYATKASSKSKQNC